MKIDVLTLFPASFAPLNESIIGRARANGLVDVKITNIRDFADGKHKITDERLYGGGAGMVMKPEPIFAAVEAVKSAAKPRIIVTSPQGKVFDQHLSRELAAEEQLILICGHYEGIDERVIEALATDVISIGDFVLTGGEIAAMAMIDSVCRLLPDVLGHADATLEESFSDDLLEYPQYTRPPQFLDMPVPEELLSGDHARIAVWRRQQSLLRTWQNRPDLLQKAALTQDDLAYLDSLKQAKQKPFRLFAALLHYPVYNKKHQVVNTSLTNLDLHDIARAAATFGLDGFYLVQPQQAQRRMMQDLLDHWLTGGGAKYNPDRYTAMQLVSLQDSLDSAIEAIGSDQLQLIATSAKAGAAAVPYRQMRRIMEEKGGDYLLLFGTGWGLTDELIAAADYCLRPIYGKGAYNHLSVRSAAAIIFDRLMGENNAR